MLMLADSCSDRLRSARVAVKCCCVVTKTVFNDRRCSFQHFSVLSKDLFQVAVFPHIYFEMIFFLLPALKRVFPADFYGSTGTQSVPVTTSFCGVFLVRVERLMGVVSQRPSV